MKTIRKITGVLMLLLTSLLVHAEVKAQTVTEYYDEDENVVILKLEDFNKTDAPVKVILVYDSNLIALETTNCYQLNDRFTGTVVTTCFSAASGGASGYMTEDDEEGIPLEDWMLDPFEFKKNLPVDFINDEEDEIELESWMLTPETWNTN